MILAILLSALEPDTLRPAIHAADTAAVVAAADTGTAKRPASFSFFFENDALVPGGNSTDRYYTNGVQAVWTRFSRLGGPSGGRFRLPAKPCSPKDPPDPYACGLYMVGLGQTMHTPANITRTTPQYDDRPYAGWSYGIASATSAWGLKLPLEMAMNGVSAWHMAGVEGQLGVIGPWAGAQHTQSMAHWWWTPDARLPQGWDHQLKNQVGANAALRYSFTLRGRPKARWLPTLEATPMAAAQGGTVMNALRGGARVRGGWNMPPEYGLGSMPVTRGTSPDEPWLKQFWAAASYEFQGRAVASNAFVTGGYADGSLRELSRIELEHLGTDRFVSGTLGFPPGASITFRRGTRSPEHRPRDRDGPHPRAHEFGILILTLNARF